MKILKLSLFIIVSSLLLVACGGEVNTDSSPSNTNESSSDNSSEKSSSSGETIKIGALHPLSGGQALEGQEMRDGARLAIQETNENGGIKSLDGAQVELVEADHEGIAEKGISEVQSLNREGVVGIIGAYSSSVALPATQEAEKSQIPFLVDIGTVDEITERGFKYTFRIQPPASMMAENFIDYMAKLNELTDEPVETAMIVHEDSVFGSSIADLIQKNINEIGIEVISVLSHASSTADMSSTINRIVSTKPDIVIATTYLNDGTLLIEGINDSNYRPKAIIGVANGAFSNAQFIEEQSDINNYILDVNYSVNPQAELTSRVKEDYKESSGKELSPNAAYAYTATKVLIDAIERAGSSEREDILEALKNTSFNEHILPQGPIVFDEKGQNKNARAVLNQIIDGETIVVYPEDFAEEEPVFPTPQ